MNINLSFLCLHQLLKLPFFIIASFLFFLNFSLLKSSIAGEGYQLTQIEAKPFTHVISRTGKVSFKKTINLSFKVAGFLTQLNVDEGNDFSTGQVLAALDTAELEANKNATYARLLQAKRNVSRIEVLLNKNLSSQRELDDARTVIDTTRAAYKIAAYNLEKSQVVAPFDGVVITRNTELGELQSPGHYVLQVAALENNLMVRVALTGDDIVAVYLGQKVKIKLDNFGVVEGEISKIPAMANNQSHLFVIEVSLPANDLARPFLVGQLAQILIYGQSQDLVYRLPIEALNAVNNNGQALIALEQNNQLIQKAFTIYKIENEHLYLQAKINSAPLDVITQGWNKLSFISSEQYIQ